MASRQYRIVDFGVFWLAIRHSRFGVFLHAFLAELRFLCSHSEHPVPKPRRSVAQQKPHQSLPHVEKSRTPPVKDTGISQPSTKVPETKTTQPLSHSVEVEPKTEKRQPRHFVHRQRIQPVSSAASQAKKVDHKGRQIPAEKGSKNRPSLSPEKKPATRTEEVYISAGLLTVVLQYERKSATKERYSETD